MKVDANATDFGLKLLSAKCFGLIEGKTAFRLTDLSREIFFPTRDPETQRRAALLRALRLPGAFDVLIKQYDGGKLPSNELTGNLLHDTYGIPETWKGRIATFFVKSCEFAGAISEGYLRYEVAQSQCGGAQHDGGSRLADEGDKFSEEDPSSSAPGKNVSNGKRQSDLIVVDREPSEGVIIWTYPCGGKTLRIETPEDLTIDVWNKLNRYLQVLKPE
jgi:hypothetical protein